jgi:hypothetical protein
MPAECVASVLAILEALGEVIPHVPAGAGSETIQETNSVEHTSMICCKLVTHMHILDDTSIHLSFYTSVSVYLKLGFVQLKSSQAVYR